MGETYDGHYFSLLSRLFFFGGCLLDVSTSIGNLSLSTTNAFIPTNVFSLVLLS